MASSAKTVVATGASSGLGFELAAHVLSQDEPHHFILGARDVEKTNKAYAALGFDSAKHRVTVLPLDLTDLRDVKAFAHKVLAALGPQGTVDYLLLNAGIANVAEGPGPHGSRWCEAYVVNHLSQHYLTHLLRPKLEASGSRIVFVSSMAVRLITDTSVFDAHLAAGSGFGDPTIYSETKFMQLLATLWWRRELQGTRCQVVAAEPGMIPGTGLVRHGTMKMQVDRPDAETPREGGKRILRAFTKEISSDPEQILLGSSGEWLGKDLYPKAFDKDLQDKWCPTLERLEAEEGIAA